MPIFLDNKILTKEHNEVSIIDFDEIWYKCSFQKNILHVFFLSTIVNEKIKTTLKGNLEYIFKDI